jgi:hypothetical protein
MRLLRILPNHDLQINMRYIPEDKKILIKARQMLLNSGLLDSVYIDPISGKVTVIIERNNGRPLLGSRDFGVCGLQTLGQATSKTSANGGFGTSEGTRSPNTPTN